MKQLIVVFEFQSVNAYKVPAFKDMLRMYEKFAFLTDTSCIIWTMTSPADVRDSLKNGLGVGDKLYVGVTTAPAAWTLSVGQEVADYIIKHLN